MCDIPLASMYCGPYYTFSHMNIACNASTLDSSTTYRVPILPLLTRWVRYQLKEFQNVNPININSLSKSNNWRRKHQNLKWRFSLKICANNKLNGSVFVSFHIQYVGWLVMCTRAIHNVCLVWIPLTIVTHDINRNQLFIIV